MKIKFKDGMMYTLVTDDSDPEAEGEPTLMCAPVPAPSEEKTLDLSEFERVDINSLGGGADEFSALVSELSG